MGTKAAAPKERMICPPDHKHNSNCYNFHHCRCGECAEVIRVQQRRRYRLKAYGRPTTNLVDAEPVRQHLRALQASGLGVRQMAKLAGLKTHRIDHILYGTSVKTPTRYRPPIPAKRVDRDVAEKLLALRMDMSALKPRTLVPVTGVQRRIHALIRNGWLNVELADMLHVVRETIGEIANGERRFVQAATHQAVAELFEKLWDVVPESETASVRRARTLSRRRAQMRGWLPALAWDDIDNDPEPPSPAAIPVWTVAERDAEIRRLNGYRWSDHRIGAAVGLSARQVLRIRHELGLPGWTKEQQEAA